jgi:diguanylate cyclase (GGDEF)-like protein
VSNDNSSEKTQNGFRIRSVSFWLASVTVVLLCVTIVTMIRVSGGFRELIDEINTYNEEEMAGWDLAHMSKFVKYQQHELSALQSQFAHQQVYIIILILLLIVSYVIIALLVLRPISKFEAALDEEQDLPTIGSVEMKMLAENFNISKRNNAASSINFEHKAKHDALTGLFNRGAFDEMTKLLSGSLEPLAILIVDVDLFKHVNDGFGHEVGDRALKKVSAQLTEKFRSSDFVFRIGGDEFCVIMQKITPSDKDVISTKIEAINTELAKTDDKVPTKLSVSVGIAFSQFGYNEELFNKADRALYYTKEHGRKGHTFYHSSIESES